MAAIEQRDQVARADAAGQCQLAAAYQIKFQGGELIPGTQLVHLDISNWLRARILSQSPTPGCPRAKCGDQEANTGSLQSGLRNFVHRAISLGSTDKALEDFSMATGVKELVSSLYDYGLGEMFVLHTSGSAAMLGQIVLDKGRLVLKDRGLLKDVSAARVGPCYDIGVVGAVCHDPTQEWKSLTFVGPELCHLEQDLTSTRLNLMRTSTNQFNERLLDFTGSVYRGFQLMLDNHYLPVVLMNNVALLDGKLGLGVTNLRMANISVDCMTEIHTVLSHSVAQHVSFDVQDMAMEADDFDVMFAQFKAS